MAGIATTWMPPAHRERWALLFDYPWRPADAPDCGRVLEEGGRIVGYLGATYVDRTIQGATARLCNMSSWYLLRAFRGQGHGRVSRRRAVETDRWRGRGGCSRCGSAGGRGADGGPDQEGGRASQSEQGGHRGEGPQRGAPSRRAPGGLGIDVAKSAEDR